MPFWNRAIDERRMSFWEHLEDLRWVLLKSFSVLMVTTGLSFAFTDLIFALFRRPLERVQGKVEIIFSTPIDAFMVELKLALLSGVFLALPFMLGFFWSFVAPGLTAKERQAVWHGVGFGVVFFCIGVTFGYCLLPYGLEFLISFGPPGFRQMWSFQVYLDFCVRLLLAFGLVFQLPVILTILVRLELVSVDTLVRIRPFAVVAIFVVAAVLTPPDAFSQIVMAVPLVVLYEVSILVGRWQERRQAKASAGPEESFSD